MLPAVTSVLSAGCVPMVITGATSATFAIPGDLTEAGSPYYYYCVVSATGGAEAKPSNVATIIVAAAGGGGECNDPYFEGCGTAASPFLIGTAAQLAKLAELVTSSNATNDTYGNKYYQLTADIDISDYADIDRGYGLLVGWLPIGGTSPGRHFSGNFNGDKHTVKGLYIKSTIGGTNGLFGGIDGGTVRNLGVAGIVITSGGSANNGGGLAGAITRKSTITNCFTSVTVTGGNHCGGIVGAVSNSDINNCYATGGITGYSSGGIVGSINGGDCSIISCYATGPIRGSGINGGIVGLVTGNGINNIKNCAALNPNITRTEGSSLAFGKVVGGYAGTTTPNVSGTVAFGAMVMPIGLLVGIDGDEIGLIVSGGIISALGGLFTEENGWTTGADALPGLFGETVDMPVHLK